MVLRIVAVLVALLAVGGILTGTLYSWTMALGIFWFGTSFLVLVLVMSSFKADMASRLGEPRRHD